MEFARVSYPLNDFRTPVEYFMKYLTEDLLDNIVVATNQLSLINTGKSLDMTKNELLQLSSSYNTWDPRLSKSKNVLRKVNCSSRI